MFFFPYKYISQRWNNEQMCLTLYYFTSRSYTQNNNSKWTNKQKKQENNKYVKEDFGLIFKKTKQTNKAKSWLNTNKSQQMKKRHVHLNWVA